MWLLKIISNACVGDALKRRHDAVPHRRHVHKKQKHEYYFLSFGCCSGCIGRLVHEFASGGTAGEVLRLAHGC